MRSSVFSRMAQLITVRDMQSPLAPELEIGQSVAIANDLLLDAALEEGYDPMDRISLVVSGVDIVGWAGFDMLDAEKTVGEIADPIQAATVLSADTTALEAVQLFGATHHHFFFVLDHHQITGTFHYQDLFSLPFKLCLFALTLDLEDSALRLALTSPGESWECLSEERRKKAEAVYELRYGHSPQSEREPLDQFLGCTMFCDKKSILKKRKLLREPSGKTIDSVFSRAEEVRNACAHTNPDTDESAAMIERTDLCQFIVDVQAVIGMIQSALEDLRAGR